VASTPATATPDPLSAPLGSLLPLQQSSIYWRSLNYFNLYRIVVAGVFAFTVLVYGDTLSFGTQNLALFASVSFVYLILAVAFYGSLQHVRGRFNVYLTLQVATDILALTLLMYASGGAKSGITIMLLVVLAGAGLVGEGRLTLFYAALATLAVQFEQAYRVLKFNADPQDFVHAGITSIAFFATAITARLLARRVVANQSLAHLRGMELADQLRINERVIRDMQDGVLVVDADGLVRQHNPQAERLLGVPALEHAPLINFSDALAELYGDWDRASVESTETFRATGSGRLLRARFLPAGEGEHTLIYLQDFDQVQAQAQQLKLAALGRLTANMAHEIRNPLSAVSHAADLLAEDRRDDVSARLIGIIGENTRRINRLIAEVLELGRRDRAQPEVLPLQQFLTSFLDEYSMHTGKVKETVALAVDDGLVLEFDPTHLSRVLLNLLGNGLRHCRGQAGSVRLHARLASRPGRTELHVIDDGDGIAPALRGQVFEPFFTTHSSGTGLGLYIARELCDANGAALEVLDNAPGAHFRITGKGKHVS
jgi:two-component system sensor histidine kinase PilS (NtrC family)